MARFIFKQIKTNKSASLSYQILLHEPEQSCTCTKLTNHNTQQPGHSDVATQTFEIYMYQKSSSYDQHKEINTQATAYVII